MARSNGSRDLQCLLLEIAYQYALRNGRSTYDDQDLIWAQKAIRLKGQVNKRWPRVNDGTITSEVIERIKNTSNCYYCTALVNYRDRQIEHKIPMARGGKHTASNLVMACKPCNMRKHTQTDREFFRTLKDTCGFDFEIMRTDTERWEQEDE